MCSWFLRLVLFLVVGAFLVLLLYLFFFFLLLLLSERLFAAGDESQGVELGLLLPLLLVEDSLVDQFAHLVVVCIVEHEGGHFIVQVNAQLRNSLFDSLLFDDFY